MKSLYQFSAGIVEIFMHRRRTRDTYRRFLPNKPNPKDQLADHKFDPFDAYKINPFTILFQNLGLVEPPPQEPLVEKPLENPWALIIYEENMACQANNSQPTFDFPILNQNQLPNLKNIPSSTLPKFYGLVTEDPDTFLFEFDILCRSYD